MKADGCDSRGTIPQSFVWKAHQRRARFFASLQKCMRNRLEQRGHSVDRSMQPDFRHRYSFLNRAPTTTITFFKGRAETLSVQTRGVTRCKTSLAGDGDFQ